jgi:two-component system, NarL family, nitrate/nitrite response regulator NarL
MSSMVAGPRSASQRLDRPIRVVLADDECLFRASLRQLLSVPPQVVKDVYGVDVGPGFEVIGEAGSGDDTVRVVNSVRPDLLLLDLSMPRMSGLEALRELATCRDSIRSILLAGTIDRTHLLTAVHLGVRGLLLKDVTTELLFEAIMCVMAGQCWLEQTLVTHLLETVRPLIQSSTATGGNLGYGLTPRERQVLEMVVAGCPNKEIARACSVSEQTIKHHLTRVFDKVGASSRVELVMIATRQGLLEGSSTVPTRGAIPSEPTGFMVPAAVSP